MNADQARKAGVEAFKSGRPAAPALNQSFLIAACSSDADMNELMSAYANGWTIAHLASGALDSEMPSVKALAEIEAV